MTQLGEEYRIGRFGNSLAVQWLGLHASTARGMGSSLVGELRSRKLRSKAKKIEEK